MENLQKLINRANQRFLLITTYCNIININYTALPVNRNISPEHKIFGAEITSLHESGTPLYLGRPLDCMMGDNNYCRTDPKVKTTKIVYDYFYKHVQRYSDCVAYLQTKSYMQGAGYVLNNHAMRVLGRGLRGTGNSDCAEMPDYPEVQTFTVNHGTASAQ